MMFDTILNWFNVFSTKTSNERTNTSMTFCYSQVNRPKIMYACVVCDGYNRNNEDIATDLYSHVYVIKGSTWGSGVK